MRDLYERFLGAAEERRMVKRASGAPGGKNTIPLSPAISPFASGSGIYLPPPMLGAQDALHVEEDLLAMPAEQMVPLVEMAQHPCRLLNQQAAAAMAKLAATGACRYHNVHNNNLI
jgi:hypothetical protein